ncbi:hypothetical protein SUDANB121_03631 [Nocardiopsis dassonvillei]|uniref:hypothetical protein n=1 Tax=Nocardiopsis dassonvillei TaxID=2014 RepID=UPI003F56976F
MGVDPLLLIFPVLFLLLSAAALVIGFTAPYGRRALTVVGGALLLAGSGLELLLTFASSSIHEAVSSLNGGRTASIALNVLAGVSDLLWATGLLLVALAAVRRRPRPRAAAGPPAAHGAPYGGHPGAHPAGPQRPGPQPGGPGQGGPGGPQAPGPRPGGPGRPGPRPPHTPS